LRKLAIVVATSDDGVIGKAGAVPWHIPEDMRHFRTMTLGHAVVMGRLTYDSMGKPLNGRRNIVVSRNARAIEGCEVTPTVDAALELAWTTDDEPRVIGGGQIYAEALPRVTTIYLTEVHRKVEGDAFFRFDRTEWVEVERKTRDVPDVEYVTLVRRS
jgi:dihydrofolate reductase